MLTLWVSAWFAGVTAEAQTPLELDTLLVGTFAHGLDIAPDEVEVIRRAFLRSLGDDYLLVDMETVPGFRDVPATLYLQACAPGRLPGCLAVVAQRVDVDWAMSVEVTKDPEDGTLLGDVVYVRVADGSLHHQSHVDLSSDRDEAFRTMRHDLDLVLAETFRPFDYSRMQAADMEAAALERRAALARGEEDVRALEELETSEGELVRGRLEAQRDRISTLQLRQWASREGDPPWKRLHLTPYQFRRQRNNGFPLEDFQRRAKGRTAQLLIGTGVGGSVGPFGQAWEGWYLLDRADLSVLDRATSLETFRADADATWSVELGVGVLPWLSVHAEGGARASNWTQRLQRVVEGDPVEVEPVQEQVVATWHVGGHVAFAPLPTYPGRPTLAVGAYGWWGTPPAKLVTSEPPKGLTDLPALRQIVFRLSPGIEVDAGRFLSLWARGDFDVPVAGVTVQRDAPPTGALGAVFPSPSSTGKGIAFAGRAGITARIPLLRR